MADASANFLSKRGQYTLKKHNILAKYVDACFENEFHPIDNPSGLVNAGGAVDKLMESEIEARVSQGDIFHFKSSHHQHYYEFHGKNPLRMALANFFNKYFNVAENVSPHDLITMSGTSSCLDSLSFALFDPDDIYLTPTPTYYRVFTDFNDRSLAQPCSLELPEEPDSEGRVFALRPQLLEDRILQLKSEGKNVRGFFLINPQNPLGDIYSPQLVRSLLEICAKYEIHAIFDEVYALTLLNPDEKVTSVLSIPDLPDPQRTHFVWSLTKDFGLAGFRVGVIHTRNKPLQKVLKDITYYCPPASIIQDAVTALLSDTKWLDEVFLPLRRQRLHARHRLAKTRLEGMGVAVRPARAGLFLWFSLRKFLKEDTAAAEIELLEKLFSSGLFVIPGTQMFCRTPGWFRMIFTLSEEEIERGMQCLETVIREAKK